MRPQACNPSLFLTFRLFFVCVAGAGCIFIRCTPPRLVIQKCPEPLWKEYAYFQPVQVKEEIARLETLLKRGDTASSLSGRIKYPADSAAWKKPSALEITRRLFELSVHHANPDFDIDRIITLASHLGPAGGPDSLRYINWERAAQKHKALLRERDSLAAAVSGISEREKKDSRSMEGIKKEMKACGKQRDSLSAVIAIQRETIMKLQKVDVMMEQQRSTVR
jgi:hypothetical protein